MINKIKYFSLLLALVNNLALADNGYTLNISNQTLTGATLPNLQVYCNGATVGMLNTPSSTIQSFNIPAQVVCEIKDNTQIFATLKQDSNAFDIQESVVTPNPAYQNLKISYANNHDANDSGWFQTAQLPLSYGGSCKQDGSSGITCSLNNEPSTLNITLTGGTAPTPPSPIAPYTYPADVSQAPIWDATTVYQTHYHPTLYPVVKYNDGNLYVACWYASGNIPGQGDPWRLYDPNKNVCTS